MLETLKVMCKGCNLQSLKKTRPPSLMHNIKFNDISVNFLAPAKGATVIMVTTVSSTALEVTWEKLHENETNGDITGYRVCYSTEQLSSFSCPEYQDAVGVDNTTFNLIGLNEATSYFVAVKAGTQAGFGPNGNNLNNTTLEASKYCQ
jgi:hypothetical protein